MPGGQLNERCGEGWGGRRGERARRAPKVRSTCEECEAVTLSGRPAQCEHQGRPRELLQDYWPLMIEGA